MHQGVCALSNILINILEDIGCMPVKFIDDMKLGGKRNTFDEKKQFLKALDRLNGELTLVKRDKC